MRTYPSGGANGVNCYCLHQSRVLRPTERGHKSEPLPITRAAMRHEVVLQLELDQTTDSDPLLSCNCVQQVDVVGFKENCRITELIDGVHDGTTARWL